MSALVGRYHDVARLLEHEAIMSKDHEKEDAAVLAHAALILRRRGDKEDEKDQAALRARFASRRRARE